MAGKVPPAMEELRTKTEYQPANDPLGFPQAIAQKIVNRLLEPLRLWRGQWIAASSERFYIGSLEGPPTIKPPALPQDTHFPTS
jgi:hypothetical protein